MAFRATNIIPEQAFAQAKTLAATLKSYCVNRSNDYATGATGKNILDALSALISYKEQLESIRTTPGIGAYAQEQEGDPAYDVGAEFVTLLSLLDATIQDIIATFPTDGSGYLLAETLDASGNRIPRTFPGASLSGIRSNLNAVANGVS